MFVDVETLRCIYPELILIVIAAFLYVCGAFGPNRFWWSMFALAVTVIVGANLFVQRGIGMAPTTGPLINDAVGDAGRWLAVSVGVLFLLMAGFSANKRLSTEVLGSLLLITAGIMLVARANELVFLFLSLELISIPTYLLLFIGRRDKASAEATSRYFFLSILASALLLYGISFLYGIAGTTIIVGNASGPGIVETIASLEADAPLAGLLPVALVLIVAGLGFKISVVPFHMYAPDVYQGTTSLNVALLSIAPKAAGVLALIRLIVGTMPGADAWQLVLVLSAITMTLGNVCALWQSNIRRMLAYSSIAHGGYMLIGIAVALSASGGRAAIHSEGVTATLLYLFVYGFGTVAVFAGLSWLSGDDAAPGDVELEDAELEDVVHLNGVAGDHPVAGAVIAVGLFSLAGLPPLAGFWGKLALFSSALNAEVAGSAFSRPFTVLAIVGAVNAAIAAAYYLRLIAAMYFQPRGTTTRGSAQGAAVAMVLAAALVIVIGLVPKLVTEQLPAAGRTDTHGLSERD